MSTRPTPPKYLTAAEFLIREIAAGRLSDGERLSPERDMAAEMGLAVGTLRRALADLEGKGLLERVQGSGNYIRNSPDITGLYGFFRLERPDGGGVPTAETLSVALLPKPAHAPDFGADRNGHRIRRLRRLDGIPVAIEEIWLDGARAREVRQADLSDSLYLFYRKSLGFWIARTEDRVGLAPVPGWAPTGFAPAPGATAGHVARLAQDQDGQAVEFSETWFDPATARYVARQR